MSNSNPPALFCDGKVRFESPKLARTAAGRRPHRMAYRCRQCEGWHVGTKSPKYK